ncbi:hypothetical protein JAK73_00375 [Stenotrophomonas maltophilia]|nr:hypothetical protein [Stenotrophomonas maltophilia]
MSNDKKTLADVQPGGRVRLGDQEFAQGCDELRMRTDGERSAYLEGVAEGRRAALAAQPSPGGQDADMRALAASIGEVAHRLSTYMPHLSEWADRARDCKKAAEVLSALAARQPVGDQHPDDLAVDAFAAAMKAKMAEARAKGRGGWEDPAQCTAEDLSRMLRDHVEKGDPRDVANFCMMLHQRGEAIAARQPVGDCSESTLYEAVGNLLEAPGSWTSGYTDAFHDLRDAYSRYGQKPVRQEPVGVATVVHSKHFDKTQCTFMRSDVPEGTKLYAAPNAQAVDLGQFVPDPKTVPDCFAEDDSDAQYNSGWNDCRDAVLALIDSKADAHG